MEYFDAYKELTGATVVSVKGAYIFPSVNGLILENNGRFYMLTSESLIDVKEIN